MKRAPKALIVVTVFTAVFMLSANFGWAQDEASAPPADTPAAAPAEAPAAAPAEAPAAVATAKDGPRFRWGIALNGGLEKLSVVSGPMGGLDVRLGLQLNDLLGFYAQSFLALGSVGTNVGGALISGFTGTFAVAAMAEATILDRFFAGAGVGYGVLNNPSGFMFQARAGGYPLMGRAADSVRRKGLMLGLDVRTVFVDGGTGLLVMGAVGYEAF